MEMILIDYLKENFAEEYDQSQYKLRGWIDSFEQSLFYEDPEYNKVKALERELALRKPVLQTRFAIYCVQRLDSVYPVPENTFLFCENFISGYFTYPQLKGEVSPLEEKVTKKILQELQEIGRINNNPDKPEWKTSFTNRFAKNLFEVNSIRLYYIFLIEKLKNIQSLLSFPEEEHRIKCRANKEEIKNYFFKLTEKQSDSKPILSEEQVMHLLHANFADFNPPKEKIKFKTTNTTQTFLRRFVRAFYLEYTFERTTEAYINLLLENFSIFENNTFESERSNFSK